MPFVAAPPRPQVYVGRQAWTKTSRLTVAFRLVLAVPHLVAWWAVGYAAQLIAFIAWFAALFTGRVPVDLYGVLAWYVRYGTRVWAYVGLLTDRWPGFSDAADYPVMTWLPGPDRLSRAAVFFRWVLVFPAAMLAGIVAAGVGLASPILWLIVLISGRMPRALFNALASVVRFHTRYYSYAFLLTAAYPLGLFGDPDDRRETDDVPSSEPVPAPEVPRPPVLHRSARRLVTLFVVLGSLVLAGYFTAVALQAAHEVNRLDASAELSDAYHSIVTADFAACASTPDEFTCRKEAARQEAESLSEFEAAVHRIDFPSDVRRQVAVLDAATSRFADEFRQLADTHSLAEYRAFIGAHDLRADGQALDDATVALGRALERSG
ncbi:MAG: DUF4389 domain-containing protein [Frankiaceae bacterium]|nr:DUF4389 domain-containing protein [Frankiaceae bacterium]